LASSDKSVDQPCVSGHDGVILVVLVECAWLLGKCSKVAQMTSQLSDHLSLGSVKKPNVVHSKGVTCEDYFSNWKIPKQQVQMESSSLMLLDQ